MNARSLLPPLALPLLLAGRGGGGSSSSCSSSPGGARPSSEGTAAVSVP